MSERILVVRYRFIGDMILTIPFLRNLRNNFPTAQIDMLAAPNSYEVISNCPYVDNFIIFDTTRKHRYECGEGKKKSFWHYVFLLNNNHYDKAYVLKRSFSSALLCFLAGIPQRIGFNSEGRGFLLTKKIEYDNHKHESECFLDVLRAESLNIDGNYLENWVEQSESYKIDEIFKENNIASERKKVVVHATATNKNKEWSEENFARVIKYLDEQRVQVIHIGAKSDIEKYNKIYSYLNELNIKPLNLCGQLSLRESLALLKKVDLIVGNDSGNLHMSASVGTKVAGIYGAMPVQKWGAIGEGNILLSSNVSCAPCKCKGKCKFDHICLKSISVESVISAVNSLLNLQGSAVK